MSKSTDPKAQWDKFKGTVNNMTLNNVQLGSYMKVIEDMDNAVGQRGRELVNKWHAAQATFAVFIANNFTSEYIAAVGAMDNIVKKAT
ncbi:uncharacterized protein STEHIDRAFT_156693 [Stereum hirsutum FP-91666 SS1]|uniref:uncharacterized protein n=1 Tax=Stereum hirsutum (strain FP-91666) TaxID=721885 RepID=UPI000440D81E|nr:uncharacterized protein STEHIDRAFT_156693 [Stereum hirsutum FP-91666 SS1]EIM86369.1 hypothetical protein STEHIDRAFT_156693 [Stereum hirsutum FP-91666 SS1]